MKKGMKDKFCELEAAVTKAEKALKVERIKRFPVGHIVYFSKGRSNIKAEIKGHGYHDVGIKNLRTGKEYRVNYYDIQGCSHCKASPCFKVN